MKAIADNIAHNITKFVASCSVGLAVLSTPTNSVADHDGVASPRPVYVFVHRANDVPPNNDNDIQEAIDSGGNAIEFDLYACESGWRVHHDRCSGTGSSTLEQWLAAYRNTSGRSQLRAIAFDLKAPAPVSTQLMQQLVDQARAAIGSDILIIYGVGDWDNRRNLEPILQGLHGNEIVAIDQSGRSDGFAEKAIGFFEDYSVVNQAFADGITAISPAGGGAIVRNLADAVAARDGSGRTRLVYSWTYESEAPIRDMLIDLRLDGVLVNDCKVFCFSHLSLDDGLENALDVLEDHSEIIRLAGPGDERHWGLYALQPSVLNAAWH